MFRVDDELLVATETVSVGASSDPVLTPVTSSNSGRSPAAVQPQRTPAPNAPLSPPPEIASTSAEGSFASAASPSSWRWR